MTNRKRVFWATTALFTGLMASGAAFAQSTGTEATEVEAVVVTGQRGPRNIDGLATAETVAKTRNTIGQEFISTQAAGQTVLQTLNLTPGLSFFNADPYGSSGGNIRLRGFDGNRVSLTFDGIPLNDTGNYASYTNQQLDPELIERASVNTGSTDVDSPTASATGGTVNYVSRRPAADFGGWVQGSLGDFSFRRIMGLIDTGEVGPWGTSAWMAVSYQKYDKFKGFGDLEKIQYNARIYQALGDNGDFIALSGHYNENRNFNYQGPNLRTVGSPGALPDQVNDPTNPFGWNIDFNRTYTAPTFRNGTADVDSNSTAYWGLRTNPSNTGNIRGNSRFTLRDGLVLTVDPSFQYTLANGGSGQTTLQETAAVLRGTKTTGGVDLNGDGDTLDTVRVHAPSNTNTHRYGVNSSLIWDLNSSHRLRAAYALDWGRHRQTGEYAGIDFSNPAEPRWKDVFGGRNDENLRIYNLDGYFLRSRDRKSIAMLNQFSLEYRGRFFDDALTVNVGVRAPFFKRELNQYCYSQNNSSNVLCTTQVPNATLANGNVTFAGSTTQYIKPYSAEKKYDEILPNLGATWRFAEGHSAYVNYASTLSAPRTDSLYTVGRLTDGSVGNPNVTPEKSSTLDVGYRYTSSTVIGTLAAFKTNYQDRIVNTYDDELGFFVDRNVGDVELWGLEGSLGWQPTENLSFYASAAYLNSELQSDYKLTATTTAATKGKELVETPDLTFGLRASYKFDQFFSVGIQGKYTGERWITDVNDLKDDAFTVVDMDARFDFAKFGMDGTYLQFNVINLFDEKYYAGLGTTTSATGPSTTSPVFTAAPGYSRPFAQVGAPRTVMATLRYSF